LELDGIVCTQPLNAEPTNPEPRREILFAAALAIDANTDTATMTDDTTIGKSEAAQVSGTAALNRAHAD